LPVTVADIAYHVRASRADCKRAADRRPAVPGDATPERALDASLNCLQAGAAMVKLEGPATSWTSSASWSSARFRLRAPGPDAASVLRLGGYKVQGREDRRAKQICEDAWPCAKRAQRCSCSNACRLARAAITARLPIPTIGIGAAPQCDGQVLVLHDLLGVNTGIAGPSS
jgi:3-methyl-2-oxobutanoate hydroxymethyltransferase